MKMYEIKVWGPFHKDHSIFSPSLNETGLKNHLKIILRKEEEAKYLYSYFLTRGLQYIPTYLM